MTRSRAPVLVAVAVTRVLVDVLTGVFDPPPATLSVPFARTPSLDLLRR